MTLNNDIELSQKCYQQGLEFYDQGKYREAIKEHTKAIKLNPSNLDALFARSNAYCQIGEFKKAIENLNEQSLLLSNDAYYHHILGSAYFGLEEHDCALSYFNQSIKIDPTNPLVYFARGLIHSILGDYALAVEDLSIALKELRSLDIQNELSIAYRNLGMTYWCKEEKENALYHLNRSILLNPNEPESYLYRGALYASMGHIENARKDYIQSSQYAPFLSEPFLLIGMLYKKIGKKEEALEFYNKAIERDSNFSEAYLMRGFLKHEMKNTIEAIRDFDAVSRIYPLKDRDSLAANFNSESRCFVHFIYSGFGMIWNPSLILTRGLIKVGYDIESAIDDFKTATKFISLSSENYQLLFDLKTGLNTKGFQSLAIAYLYLGDYEKSIQNLNYYINIDPEYGYSYYLRCLLLAELNQNNQAIWDIKEAIKLFSQQSNQLGSELSIKLLIELEQPSSIDIISELQKIYSFIEYAEKRFDDITIHSSNELTDLKTQLNSFRNRQTEDSFRIDSLEVKSDNLMQRLILLEESICDDIEEGFSNIKVLSDKVIDISKNLEELQNSSVDFNQNLEHWLIELNSKIKLKSPNTTLVVGRKGSKRILYEALELCHNQLILVCPWLCETVINSKMIQKMQLLLKKNATISIGWGFPEDEVSKQKIRNQSITRNDFIASHNHPRWKYSAISSLERFEKGYPDQFKLTQPRGTHEKYLVCDHQFAMITSHNFLTSGDSDPILEVGIRTTETHIIEELIQLFENPIY